MELKTDLQIPEEIDNMEFYNGLSFNQKGLVIENCLYKVFELNKDRLEGITINELRRNLPFSKNSILRGLTKLLAKREIYCIKGRPNRYYKNGRVSHHIANSAILLPNKVIDLRLFVNIFGKIHIFMQEKAVDILSDNDTSGGLIIDAENFREFVEGLQEKVNLVENELKLFKKKLKELID